MPDNYWKNLFEKSEQQKEKMIQQEKQEKAELINLFRKEKQDFMKQIEILLTKVGNNNVTNIQQNNIIQPKAREKKKQMEYIIYVALSS